MSSITQTIVLQSQASVERAQIDPSYRRLVFHDPAEKWNLQLRELLTTMQETCRLLPLPASAEASEMLRMWEWTFQNESRIHSKVDEEKMEAIYDLCCLHYNLVYLAGHVVEKIEDKQIWKGHIACVKALIQEHLPSEMELEPLLERYAQRFAEGPLFEVLDAVEEADQLSCNQINRTAQQFGESVVLTRDLLEDVYQENELSLEETYREIDGLQQEISELGQGMMDSLERVGQEVQAISVAAYANSAQVASAARSVSSL